MVGNHTLKEHSFPEGSPPLIQQRDDFEENAVLLEAMSDSQQELFEASMEQVFGTEPVNQTVIDNIGNALMWADKEQIRKFYDYILEEFHSIDPKEESPTAARRNTGRVAYSVGDGHLGLSAKTISKDLDLTT